jgi:hypothetical protein
MGAGTFCSSLASAEASGVATVMGAALSSMGAGTFCSSEDDADDGDGDGGGVGNGGRGTDKERCECAGPEFAVTHPSAEWM